MSTVSIGAPGIDGAPGANASTPSISTPSLQVSQADIPILQTGTVETSSSYSHVTYGANSPPDELPWGLHAPDQSASFLGG